MDWAAFGEFVNKVGGVAIGLAGSAVAAIALVFTHRERTAAYRAHLFQTQVSVLMDLADAAAELVRKVLQEALSIGVAANPDEPFLQNLPERESLIRLRQRAKVILPNSVNHELGAFLDAIWQVTGARNPGAIQNERPDLSQEALGSVVTTYDKVVDTTRHALGIDHLASETTTILGGRDVLRSSR